MYYSLSNRPPRRTICNDEPSLTIQSAADECDINRMIDRYNRTGSYHGLISQPSAAPSFGDFSDVSSYHEAQNKILAADSAFAALPAAVRDRFRNNPAELISFLEDPNNFDEARLLGLVPPVEVSPDASAD